jgi:dynactin complex subunit
MLQTSRCVRTDESVKTQRNIDNTMLKEMLMMKERELEELKIEKEIEVMILKNQLEVRNISVFKVCFNLSSWKLQILSFCIEYTSDFPSDLNCHPVDLRC